MRVVILQHGDYGDIYRRLRDGGPETYRDQRHSVNFVESMSSEHDVITIAACDRTHDEMLSPRLRSIGMPASGVYSQEGISPLLEQLNPDVFLCRTPSQPALAWAANRRVPTLPTFADIIRSGPVRGRLYNWKLGRTIRQCVVPCVANHSLTASKSLVHLGLRTDQIVPWELKRLKPTNEAKVAPRQDQPFQLFFAGILSESKGVGDCIDAVAIAKKQNARVELTIAGPGDASSWSSFARERGVESSVRILGVIPSDRVLSEMRSSDAVIVPSRPSYSEGLPNTIFEAFASRTPLIASDHPAFVERLNPGIDSLRFHAGHPEALAEQVHRLMSGPEIYTRLSQQSANALSQLYVGIEWSELVSRFLEDPYCKRNWVRGLTLADLTNERRAGTSVRARLWSKLQPAFASRTLAASLESAVS
jgi:glycosyltransferase involved in cell wall biosynthesis